MGKLSDKFHEKLAGNEEDPKVQKKVADMVMRAPESAEKSGLLSLMYHEGIGVEVDMDKSFEYAESAAFGGGDGLGYFMLGYMCDNIETPDQAEGGPRQKYDHYDAERFYELCAERESRWAKHAHLWLGDYFMDFAKGGDPEVGLEHYLAISEESQEAVEAICDYYEGMRDAMEARGERDEEVERELQKWARKAAEQNPEEYGRLLSD